MDKTTRNVIERATQQARKLLNDEFSDQLAGTFDVLRSGIVPGKGGAHLTQAQQTQREKIVAAIEHKRAAGMAEPDAITDYIRDAAFTTLNRFVALKMLETRGLVQECITKGENSAGYREFCGLAPGVTLLPDSAGYRLYIECLFDEFSTEIKVLFDRRDAASVLWPGRETFERLLTILNAQELSGVWNDDETIGWVFQFFNSGEERKAMRENQAPRNSREMAVRNQFFTPRYVVQFLVDNTLGRLWLEMLGEKSQLAHNCEYFVRSAEEAAQEPPQNQRPRKDPRDLRILDPACGSGHFLLYSFDLLLRIYEEAWEAKEDAPVSEATGHPLRTDYPSIEELRRHLPRLIVEQNLYGVDIDPRCAQIAALVLWLRAQRAWKDLGIPASERLPIERTHIVLAEPMPGDADMLEEFAAQLNPPFYRDLFKKMVQESRLAGEMGVLMRVEDGIAAELTRAREQFVKQHQSPSFLPGMEPSPCQGSFDLSGINDATFFHEAEGRLDQALRLFVEAASGKNVVRRRLFAGDAKQGISLIDLLRTRFDIILMNPPFGNSPESTKDQLSKWYPNNGGDILTAFVSRSLGLCDGFVAGIFSRAPFFLPNYATWRCEHLLRQYHLSLICDLGADVLDGALVEAFCVVVAKRPSMSIPAFRLTRSPASEKQQVLRSIINDANSKHPNRFLFFADPNDIRGLPGCPIIYSAAEDLRKLTEKGLSLGRDLAFVEQGLSTKNDYRYLRLAVEIPESFRDVAQWAWIAKGGEYRPFFDDLSLLVKAHQGFRELAADLVRKYPYLKGDPNWVLHRESHYLRGGLTYPERTTSAFGPRCLPKGSYFSHVGLAIIPRDNCVDAATLLAWLMSRPAQLQIELQMGSADAVESGSAARHYSLAAVGSITFPDIILKSNYQDEINAICSLLMNTSRLSEVSALFVSPLHGTDSKQITDVIAELYKQHEDRCLGVIELFSRCAEQIETAFALDPELLDEEVGERVWELPKRAIAPEELSGLLELTSEKLVGIAVATRGAHRAHSKKAFLVDRKLELIAKVLHAHPAEIVQCRRDHLSPPREFAQNVSAALVSYLVGIAFGRFDPGADPLVGDRCNDPFALLPSRSPAMSNSSAERTDVLVDDVGHVDDLFLRCVKAFQQLAFAEPEWDALWRKLDADADSAREWIAKQFFRDHLGRYTDFRRKAPLYWQIGVPSGRYSVWLYFHATTGDTLYRVQAEYVSPKLMVEEERLSSLRNEYGANANSHQRRQLLEQENFLGELHALQDEVKRIAPLWNPVFGDGVEINFAPLWRLVAHDRAWQKELKATWDLLCKEEFDWAHLAMHLWPERVVPKCATDHSLAIAHGLEDVFWQKDQGDKWQPRPVPTHPVDELVRERTSPAVKAALKALLESSDAGVPARRRARNGKGAPA